MGEGARADRPPDAQKPRCLRTRGQWRKCGKGEMKAQSQDSAREERQDGTKPGKPVRRAGLCHGNLGDGNQRITLKCQAVLCLLIGVICD